MARPVSTEQVQLIQTRVTNGDTSVFRSVVRKRSRRVILYSVTVEQPFELVNTAIRHLEPSKEFFCYWFTNLVVGNDCPFNVSDHYPVLIFLVMNLLCNTSNPFYLDRKVLMWSSCDEWEKKNYQIELDKLLNFEVLHSNSGEIKEKNYKEQINSHIGNAVHIAVNCCIPTKI
ncbi:unnamed protein product [Mytilus coruscus]|uniref:Uncharacterized protein n=1 Tax=Mytilus coruscus TaxID=42192 RepID=A0A6J8AZ39_MYTCO|nr:unnamed protein product [Mytilus coruscus]